MISLDKDTVFTCPDLKSMEDVGPEEKRLLIDAVYNMCIAKGIFVTFNNNRSSADLSRTMGARVPEGGEESMPNNFFWTLLHEVRAETESNGP